MPCELALEHHDSSFQFYVLRQRDLQSSDQVHNSGRETKNDGGLHVTRFKTTIAVTTASVLTEPGAEAFLNGDALPVIARNAPSA